MQRLSLKNSFLDINYSVMRNFFKLPAIIMITLSYVACTKTDTKNVSLSQAESIIPGSYKVNSFTDNTGSGTSYDGYTFNFSDAGTLSVTNGTDTYSGLWSIQNANTSDVFNEQLVLTITGDPNVNLLNQTWFVQDITDVTLKIQDGTGNEQLSLIKF